MTPVINGIPIQNLYYLFCYAWSYFPVGSAVDVGLTDSPRILDLFAQILVRGMHRLLRRGLDRGYTEFEDELQTVRGRIDLNRTIRRNLFLRSQIACRFDELSRDVLHNRLIKSSILELENADDLDPAFAAELRDIRKSLKDVADIDITSQAFPRVRVSRDRAQYGLLLRVCELLHALRLPTQAGQATRFASALSDEKRMSKVFEHFVRNFYRHEQSTFTSVGSEMIDWDLEPTEPSFANYLPSMITDVTLRSASTTMVIDTKYYKQTLSNYRGERVYSSHLYQLYSYLSNMETGSKADQHAEGILLYPAVGHHLDLRFDGRGHRIRVRTLNLDQDWQLIRSDLLSLIDTTKETSNHIGGPS